MKTIHATFSAQAAATPDALAVTCGDERLTYAQLDRVSDGLARYLLGRGVERGARVGLYTQRSNSAVVAMLAILKAGAAYVPFDPAYPRKLLEFVHADCAPALMLVQSSMTPEGTSAFWQGPSVGLETALADSAALEVAGSLPDTVADDPAYVMYTSGSTGQPKGVLVPHRGVVRLAVGNTFAAVGANQVHLQLAPLAFDASTFEIWGALLNGGRLAVLAAVHASLDDIVESIARERVTTLWLTAGLFHLMVDHRLAGLEPLRQLLAGGDVLSPQHVAKALAGLPDCQLINGYGPTENTTFTCCYRIPRAPGTGAIPIGTAIAQTTVHILDDQRQPVAEGEAGELYAGGAGVALGYLNRPALSAERFIPDPFAAHRGALLYRTGDRVRRRSDGNIEFLGRIDRQVKINGKRIELDEIEACLRRYPAVEDGAVVAPEQQDAPRRILAYVKWRDNKESNNNGLRVFLKEELAEYMLPASLIEMAELPLSPTGKVDRARLPRPPAVAQTVEPTPSGGLSATELRLVEIWRTVLGGVPVGINDNFFDLGGTSLQLLQVHATIASVMQSDVTIVELFQYPRISALAGRLARGARSSALPDAASTAPVALTAAERARRQQAALARVRPK